MDERTYPWYWAWRGWSASTWVLLLWTALLWPNIVSIARSDDFFSGHLAFLIGVVWAIGAGVILGVRAQADRQARSRPVSEHADAGPPGALAKTLPFVAAGTLAGLVLLPVVSSWTGRPTELESAVAASWHGDEFPIELAIGGSEPQQLGTGAEVAEEVSCEQTGATVRDAAVNRCTIVYCDHETSVMGICNEATASACAALVYGLLVLVSRTEVVGRGSSGTSSPEPISARAEPPPDRYAICQVSPAWSRAPRSPSPRVALASSSWAAISSS